MQISGTNLLASQQVARPQPPQPKQAASFEPLAFRQAAPVSQTAAEKTAEASAETTAAAPARPARPGTHIDIRV